MAEWNGPSRPPYLWPESPERAPSANDYGMHGMFVMTWGEWRVGHAVISCVHYQFEWTLLCCVLCCAIHCVRL